MDFRGNRWYKCDLHIHTPESKCFPDKEVTAKQWVQTCLDKGLEVVAVTDHNSGNFIDQIIEAAQGTDLTVFPGVEITCDSSKVHLLVLFDKDKRSSDINGFLNYCGIQNHKFAEQDATTDVNDTIFVVAEKAHKWGALVIPAHIDEYNGLSVTSYQTMQTFLNTPYINGVQVVNEVLYNQQHSTEECLKVLSDRYPRINDELVKNWSNAIKLSKECNKAILTFSDNPSGPKETTHGLWGIGNRYTWIKMNEEVSLEGLRQALLMPDKRIKNDFDYKTNPFIKPEQLIKGLVIHKTILNPENPIQIQFNPQLNTIIGGRGTGKSAVNRIIRGLLNNNDFGEFSELLVEQSNFFKLNSESRLGEEKQGIITAETKIELYIERLGCTYKIDYSNYQDNQFNKTIYKINNEIIEESSENILDLFSAEIYSQKQIYNIATRPNALREKIDQSIESLSQHMDAIREVQEKFVFTTSRMRTIKNRLEKKARLELEIADIKERLLAFKEKGYQTVLIEQNAAVANFSLLRKVYDDIELKKIKLQEFREEFKYIDFNSFKFTEEAEGELKSILTKNATELQEVLVKLDEASTYLEKTKQSLNKAVAESTWYQHSVKVNNDYKAMQRELTPEELKSLENVESLSKQLDIKEEELNELIKNEEVLITLSQELDSIFNSYLDLRKEVTVRRRGFIQNVLNDTPNIKIEVRPFRDEENYEIELRKILQRPDNYKEDFQMINTLVFNGQVEKKIQEFRELIINIKETGQNDSRFTGRFNNFIKGLNDEQIEKINLLYPEDKIEVQYKANDAANFKSISNASAGQKTSAILTFLLSYGSAPLLLDQPEDDLDNQLIYELIVDRLVNSKNKRQIIVVTHNANIPVNGDSEWVVAMNSESKDIEILGEGSIENDVIKDAICTIMEGGTEAFKLRAKRYKLGV